MLHRDLRKVRHGLGKGFYQEMVSQEVPALDAWFDVTMDIYKTEKITAFVIYKFGEFTSS